MRKIIERPMKYKTGNKLGDLTVIDKIYGKNKGDKTRLLLRCSCGKEFTVLPYTLNTRKQFMCKECCVKRNIDIGKWAHGKRVNDYKIEGDVVRINQNILIDLDDLDKIKSFDRYWGINMGGYAYCTKDNQQIFMHRIIVGLPIKLDRQDGRVADHINGNKLDNRKCNLRILSSKQNPINCATYSTNTSGVKGLSWDEKLRKWRVSIQVNKQNIYLGIYKDKEEAIKVRKEAEEKYFGKLNRGA